MEKRGERKEGVPVLALAKCLLASYVLTLLLLCLLALLLYKLHLTEGMVTIAISAIYVVTTFTAGFLAGKKMETQKFLSVLPVDASVLCVHPLLLYKDLSVQFYSPVFL